MYFLFPIFIFTYLFWLCRVLTAALRIFDVCRGMQTLSCSMQDLSSLTRDQTHAPALRVQSRSPCCCLIAKSCLTLATPWTVAHQAPLSMGFPRQENWNGWPFPSPGDLSDPGIESASPASQANSLPLNHQGNP